MHLYKYYRVFISARTVFRVLSQLGTVGYTRQSYGVGRGEYF